MENKDFLDKNKITKEIIFLARIAIKGQKWNGYRLELIQENQDEVTLSLDYIITQLSKEGVKVKIVKDKIFEG